MARRRFGSGSGGRALIALAVGLAIAACNYDFGGRAPPDLDSGAAGQGGTAGHSDASAGAAGKGGSAGAGSLDAGKADGAGGASGAAGSGGAGTGPGGSGGSAGVAGSGGAGAAAGTGGAGASGGTGVGGAAGAGGSIDASTDGAGGSGATGGTGTGGTGGVGTGGSGTGGTGTGGAGTGGGGTGGTGTGGAGTGGSGTGGTGTGGAGTGGGGTGGAGTGGVGGVATGGTGGVAGSGGSGGTIQDSGVADIRRDAVVGFSINCGTMTCDSTAFCCLAEPNNFHCVGAGSTCPALTDRIHCDDTADCTAGQVCCLTDSTSNTPADAVCSTGCVSPKQMLCDPAVASPCLGSGIPGAVCSKDAGGIFGEYAYCHP